MSESAYEIAALTMRYWFAALMVFLLWRIIRAVLRDYAAQRTARKADTGYSLGMLEVVGPETDGRGKPHPLYGRRFALKRENRIGRSKSADIRVTHGRVAPHQASIFQKGNRVLLSDLSGRNGVLLNGNPIQEDTPLVDGDEIVVGDVTFALHLMSAGTGRRRPETSRKQRYQDEPAETDAPETEAEDENWEDSSPWARYAIGEDDDSEEESAFDSEEDGEENEYEPDDEDESGYAQEDEEDERAYRRQRRWRR